MQVARANTAENILREMHITDAGFAKPIDALITVAEVKAEERTRLVLLTGAGFVLSKFARYVGALLHGPKQAERRPRTARGGPEAEQERQIADLQIRQQVAEDLHNHTWGPAFPPSS